MKECFKCKEVKPYADFYKHKKMTDGYLGKCKSCTKSDVHKNREENIERIRAYDRNRPNKIDRAKQSSEYHKTKKGKEVSLKSLREYRMKNPLRYKANCAVSNALRDGRLFRPLFCEKCGVSCKPQGHHDDYTKPLSVRWLCFSCHNEFHLFMRELYRNLEHTSLNDIFIGE